MSTAERRIGRYVLLDPLGRGAMGIVYRAEDPLIHRTVAVKVLHAGRGLSEEQVRIARERFRRESQAAARIDHPNVIRVFDAGEEDKTGEMYIVMEYLSGPSLEDLINGAELGLDKAAEIIGQIASGLDAAHAQGLVHRDIKPSNILFNEAGAAKIVDFGITQVASSSLTQDMTRLGTPAYMSPEQVNGRLLDARADLFSLGVLSYEMLTGSKPFAGTDAVSVAYAIAHTQPVPISVANPHLPRALDAVLERMLAKEARERFESGRAFHEALVPCLRQGAVAPPPTLARGSLRGHRALSWGLVGVAMLVAAVFLTFSREQQEVPAAAASATPIPRSTPRPSPVPRSTPRPSPVPTSKATISLVHRIRRGTLVVSIDGVPVLTEEFSKPKLAIFKTTTWDPVLAPAGKHKVRAKVKGENGKTYLSDAYAFEFPRESGIALRMSLAGDKVTVQQKREAGP